jgi:hypothetical protein
MKLGEPGIAALLAPYPVYYLPLRVHFFGEEARFNSLIADYIASEPGAWRK